MGRNKKNKTKKINRYQQQSLPVSEPVADIGRPLSARRALKSRQLRKDCVAAIYRICPNGWQFDESKANTDGWYIDNVLKISLTSEEAEDLFLHHNYKHNRNFNQSHSEDLAEAMQVVLDISLAIGPDNHPVVVNGQHSLWAVRLGCSQLRGKPIDACFRIIQCRDEKAIAETFRIFDNNLIRPLQTIIKAEEQAGLIQTTIPAVKLAKWSQSVAVAKNNFKRVKNSRISEKRIAMVREPGIQAFADFMQNYYSTGNNQLVPQGVSAALFAMWHCDPDNAAIFAEEYFSGENLKAHSPTLEMRNRMLSLPKGQHSPSVCRLHAEKMYSAWRAFCLDKPVLLLKPTTNLPPYDEWKIFVAAPRQLIAV